MSELQQKLRALKLRKATQFAHIEMLSEVDDSAFLKFGKLEAEIMKIEKQLVRENKNIFDEEN